MRKAGNRVRITAQLIDAATGNHLWADRFDGNLDDVFDLQDRITEQIVVAVEPEIGAQERERAQRRSTQNLNAWEYFQRGLNHRYRINKSDSGEAIRLFEQATILDQRFATAHAHLAYAHWSSLVFGFADDREAALAKARAAAEHALTLDPNEPMGHYAMGRVHIAAGDISMAMNEMRSAVAINANFGFGHFGIGFVYHYAEGKSEEALPYFEIALRLSPRDPGRWTLLTIMSAALRRTGRYEEAVVVGREACQFSEIGYMPFSHLAAGLACVGQDNEARQALEKALQIEPKLSTNLLRERFVGMHENTLKNICDGLIERARGRLPAGADRRVARAWRRPVPVHAQPLLQGDRLQHRHAGQGSACARTQRASRAARPRPDRSGDGSPGQLAHGLQLEPGG